MKNKLFSALFLSIITTLAACGDNIPAEEPAAESTATPAVVSAAPAPVQVVATKCFDIGSDGILHVTGKVRFDGPVGINADPVDGTGLTSHGTDRGIVGDGIVGGFFSGINEGVYATSSGSYAGYFVGGGPYGLYANGSTAGVYAVGSTYKVDGVGGDNRVKNLESEVAQLKTLVQQLLAAQQPQ